jgi:hypothetical protein
MQLLSSFSACALVAICGLLLRSQSLLSAARSPNFEPLDPSKESSNVSAELLPIIVLLITLLAAPAVLAIILAFIKWFQSRKADSQLSSSTKVSADQAPLAVVEQYSDLCANEATDLAENIPVQLVPEVLLEDSMTAVTGSSFTPRLPDPDGALSVDCAALPSILVREQIKIAQRRQYSADAAAAGLGGSETVFASIPMSPILPDPEDDPDRLQVSRSRIKQAQQRLHARIQNAAQV